MRCVAAFARLTVLSLALAGCIVVGIQEPTRTQRPASGRPDVSVEPDRRGEALPPEREFDEVRALWVVRYTMTSAAAVREMVVAAEQAGINTLIVQVRGRGDAFYASSLEPRGESVREGEGFDPLQLAIEEAHARGMAVHAWVNTHLVWGIGEAPQSSMHILNANPDWLAVPRELGRELVGVDPFDVRFVERLVQYARDRPRTVEGVYSSPSHPSVQDRVHAVWLDLVSRYDLDGIHFDYIRFPSPEFDYSIGALERFRLWARSTLTPSRFASLDDAYVADLYAFVEGEPELWAAFRREQVTRLVRRIYNGVKERMPRLVVSAAVVADATMAFDERYQDWRGWLEEGILDVAVPMAYTPDPARFQALIRTARASVSDPRRVWAGIGAYMTTAEGTIDMIDIARTEGAGGVVLFSYDWAVGEGRGDPSNPFLQQVGRGRFRR
jgi:uncharacterized lipoprotein YddW (UPF0748 family)